jgi:NTE family protein
MKKKVQKNILISEDYFDDNSNEELDFENTKPNSEIILSRKDIEIESTNSNYNFIKNIFRKKRHKKIALVLSGGAARGIAHIGVLKELEKNNIIPDLIIGTSMGAIVGSLYAYHKNTKIFEKYINLQIKDLVSLHDFNINSGGFVSGIKIERLFEEMLFKGIKFEDLKIPIIINATDLDSGKEVIFKEGNLIKAIRASMSVPGIFSPVIYQNKKLIDGGISNNAAFNHVPKRFDLTIISDVMHYPKKISQKPKIEDVIEQVMIFVNKINEESIPNNSIIIRPKLSDINLMDIQKSKIMIKRGILSTSHKISEIKKILKMKN